MNSQTSYYVKSQTTPGKIYKAKVFRNGSVQIPGIRMSDMSDGINALIEIKKVLYKAINYTPTPEDLENKNIRITMRNYRWKFVNDNEKILNIDTLLTELTNIANGMPMNNNFVGGNNGPLGPGGNDMMGPGGFGGNFNNNNGPIPPQILQQQQQQPPNVPNFNIMPNGGPPGMMNPHANMMSPQLHQQQQPPGQMPQSQQDMMMHQQQQQQQQQQQRGNMMMDPMMQNGPPQNGMQRGPMPSHSNPPSVPSPHPKQQQYPHPGISPLPPNQQPSPHPNQPPYPQPGISPLPNQPPMNMNNPHSRVMSPMSQPGPGMMSPHHQMMNQGPPMGKS
jgi:hypothetical protein